MESQNEISEQQKLKKILIGESIPNKFLMVRKTNPRWLTNDLRKPVREKRRMQSKARRRNELAIG